MNINDHHSALCQSTSYRLGKMWPVTISLFVVLINSATSDSNLNKQNAPVTISPSGRFRGSWMETRRGRQFEAYRGIRYMKPPVQDLRFKEPSLITKYSEEVDATEDGPSCPQPTQPGKNVQEDCITINVYTPGANVIKPLPVIVFIHPGGFYSFTGRSDVIGPHYLLEKDVVFVSINYRLATLGFLAFGNKDAPGNNGMKDQVVALRWIQRNIRSFGGNPQLVTITGLSAGSNSVMLHMVSPMSKGLFHRAIAMSGSPVKKEPMNADLIDLAKKQASLLNCKTEDQTLTALKDCFLLANASELGNSLDGFFEFGYDPVGLWNPVVEQDFGQERFLTEQPLDSITSGKMHSVPLMVSQTTDEFFWKAFYILKNETLRTQMDTDWDNVAPISFMLPRNDSSKATQALRTHYFNDRSLENNNENAEALGKLYGDAITGFPAHRLARIMAKYSKHPVFYSEFAYKGAHSFYEDPVTKKPTGVAHHDDMLYLFTIPVRFPTIPLESEDDKMVEKMTSMWYNFARFGDPNPKGDTPALGNLSWPRMDPEKRQYLRIDKELTVKNKLKEDRYQLWDQLYPIQY